MIGTGGFYNGPELERANIYRMLNRVMRAVIAARGDWKEGDAPAVVVVFIVPGSLGDVNFSGQRVTLFSRKRKLLQIEVAVPTTVVSSDTIDDFALDALQQACRIAAEHFERKKAGVFDLSKANEIINRVRDTLSHGA